jgi:hypothetical protein
MSVIIVNLRTYFTPAAIAQTLKKLPPLKTPVMDTIFIDRPQLGLPVIGVDQVTAITQTVPMVKRGGASVSIGGDSKTIAYYEPLPIRPSDDLTAKDLNDFKLLDPKAGRQTWINNKIDMLRRTVRLTTEALCAQALTGAINYPLRLDGGGWDTYNVAYGSPLSFTPAKAWDAADIKIKDVYSDLLDMQLLIQDNGWGSELEIWAGKTAYKALVGLADSSTPKDKIRVELKEGGLAIAEFLVKVRAETYKNPQTGAAVKMVADNQIVVIGKDGGQRLFYCAVDDLEANLLPMPFFVKPIERQDPSGVRLVAESKPFPAPNIHAICWATVAA